MFFFFFFLWLPSSHFHSGILLCPFFDPLSLSHVPGISREYLYNKMIFFWQKNVGNEPYCLASPCMPQQQSVEQQHLVQPFNPVKCKKIDLLFKMITNHVWFYLILAQSVICWVGSVRSVNGSMLLWGSINSGCRPKARFSHPAY